MPLGDGTGPQGKGPGTGQGRGGCRPSAQGAGGRRGMPLFGGVDFDELRKRAEEYRARQNQAEDEQDSSRDNG